jgi:hypothetical protein
LQQLFIPGLHAFLPDIVNIRKANDMRRNAACRVKTLEFALKINTMPALILLSDHPAPGLILLAMYANGLSGSSLSNSRYLFWRQIQQAFPSA